MNLLGYLLLLICLWSTAPVAWSDSAGAVPVLHGQASVDAYAYFLEDPSATLSIQDVQSPQWQSRFQQNPETRSFNKGINASVYWVRITLAAETQNKSADNRLLLEIPYAPLDNVQFFQPGAPGGMASYQSGDTLPFKVRPIKHFMPIFPISTVAGQENVLYLRVASAGTMRIPLILWEETAFFDHNRSQLLTFGLYFGIMLLMFLYNLLFFIWLKDFNFLYYILYIGSLSIFQAAYTGLGIQYGWQAFTGFNNYAVIVMILLVDLFAALFARRVLGFSKNLPKIDRLMKGMQIFFVIALAACFALPYSFMLTFGTLVSILFALALIGVTSLSAYRGHRTARLFLTAWLAFLSGAIVLGGVTLGVLPATPLTSNAMLIGSTIEVILLSLMLADRVHTTEKDKTRTEKKAKVALQAVNRALLESNRVKDEFLATISHEMRTPMNGVINCLVQAQQEDDPKKASSFVGNAEDAAHHLMNLIDSVLSYTELQTHEFKINVEPFSLQKMLESLADIYERAAQQKGIYFRIKVNPDVPTLVSGDRRRLLQILSNLVDNAIKFTSQGTVNLNVSTDSIDKEHHRTQLAFSITDTGMGIPAGMEYVVFDRFKQLTGTHNRRHGGMGIGLAVCKQMASLMGADLRYRSTVGEGTEFVLSINLEYRDNIRSAAQAVSDIQARATGRKVLIVEDNPVNQLVLKAALQKLGFEVVCANNGAEGVAAVERHAVDVVLMDCQMPVMDGFEATRNIRALATPKANIPIIAITANAMSRDRDACLNAGMNDYMSKPVNVKLLEDMLLKWLPSSESLINVLPPNQAQAG